MIETNFPEMIIFIGIPASGKSTFYRQNFAETHVCVSLDILRTRFQEGKLLGELLSAGKSCVIDNTNVELAERKKYIDAAKTHGYKIIGYYFRSTIDECRIRNNMRERQVPEIALRNKAAHLELPSKSEGFDELYYVSICENQFNVNQFKEL